MQGSGAHCASRDRGVTPPMTSRSRIPSGGRHTESGRHARTPRSADHRLSAHRRDARSDITERLDMRYFSTSTTDRPGEKGRHRRSARDPRGDHRQEQCETVSLVQVRRDRGAGHEGQVKRSKPIRGCATTSVIFQGEPNRRDVQGDATSATGMECGIGVKQYNESGRATDRVLRAYRSGQRPVERSRRK